MSFGITFSWSNSHETSRKIYYAILEAEEDGKNEVTVETKHNLESSLKIGQIIYYKSKEEKTFKNYWRIKEILDTRNWSDSPYGGRMCTSGSEAIVFESFPEYFVNTEKTKVPYEEVLKIKEEIKELGFSFGGYTITQSGKLGKLLDVVLVEVYDNERSNKDSFHNPNRISIYKEEIRIKVANEGYGLQRYDFTNEFKDEEVMEFDKFKNAYHPLKWNEYSQIKEEVDKILLGSGDDEQLLIGDSQESVEDNNSQLVGFGDSKHLKMIANVNKKKVNLTCGVIFFDKRTVDLQKEEVDRMMANIKSKSKEMIDLMNLNVLEMNNKIREMYRVIDTIEIFTGVHEEIYQIQEGEDSKTGVINLFQRKLFMDEEVGVHENGGIDFSNIEDFDSWACKNIDVLIPMEVGIVIMQPRRNGKPDYTREKTMADIFRQSMEDEANSNIYIIIRNGSNIYRIWSDNIPHHKRLFPLKEEFQDIMNKIVEAEKKMAQDVAYYNRVMNEKELVDSKDNLFYYIRNFLLIQGLIHRTKIFSFIPSDFNIMNIDTHNGVVNYVYDDDKSNLIGDGLPSFSDWLKSVNANIKRGKKVLLFPTKYNKDARYDQDRFNIDFNGRKILYPPNGTYTVRSEKKKIQKKKLHEITEKEFLDNPKLYERGWYRTRESEYVRDGVKYMMVERVNHDEDIYFEESEEIYITFFQNDRYEMFYNQWIRYKIYPTDDFLVCYEDIDDKTLDYYLTDREARRKYLTVIPLLESFKEEKRKDNEIEKYYVDMILSRLIDINISETDKLVAIKEAIEFWKFGGKTFVNTFSTIKQGSVDEIKSVKVILDEAKRIIKKRHSVDITLNVNVRNKIQHISTGRYNFYVKGLSKKEFVDLVSFEVRDTKKKLNVICNVLTDVNVIKEITPKLEEGKLLIERKF